MTIDDSSTNHDDRRPEPDQPGFTRRAFVLDAAGVVAAGALGGQLGGSKRSRLKRRVGALDEPAASQLEALRVLGRSSMRLPDSLPHPALPAGTDTLPEIEHVVMLMMENHSYDNFFGMLGRQAGQFPRGDGYTIAADGYPAQSNPYPSGKLQRAFHMPTTCQLSGKPTQEWEQAHIQYASGRNSGFVISGSGPVAMGFWDQRDLPFTYALASQFPVGDRWFCSVLGQTDPNRRYLIAATSMGMTDDVGSTDGNATLLAAPPNGTIFSRLTDAGISWLDYNEKFPLGATMELYPTTDTLYSANAVPMTQFFSDAKAGTLPSFCLLDPDYSTQSQENPQNIVVGESYLASVVDAVTSGPAWRKTILIITYDEHGGYFDHVPPPAALPPDNVQPVVEQGESTYGGFNRYGFRVPSIVVSPYSKTDYVSHVVYDHTSVLAFVERKWNLPAMTYRDANANDLTDFLDLTAMSARNPTFAELPKLPASGQNSHTLACSTTGPGTIPPVAPPAIPLRVELINQGLSTKHGGLMLELYTTRSSLRELVVELHHEGQIVGRTRIGKLTTIPHTAVLRSHGKRPHAGRYEIVVRKGKRKLVHRSVVLR